MNVFVRNLARSQISDEVFYYTTNVQIQAHDLRPHGKDLAMDLGFGAANGKNPVVLVIGDAFVPEIYDGLGSRVIILRIDGASFGTLKDFVLKVFANKTRANAAVLPPGFGFGLGKHGNPEASCWTLLDLLLRVRGLVVQVSIRRVWQSWRVWQSSCAGFFSLPAKTRGCWQ